MVPVEPSEGVLRGLLAAAPDALLAADSDGRIVFVNDQAERLFGWRADEIVGKQIEILVPADAGAVHVRHRAGYVADPSPRPMGAGRQLSGRRKDDSSFPAEISLSAVTDAAGSVLVLAAVRDVTDRLEIQAERERQALAAQREQSHRLESLGQLAGGVAHDFNNLLGVILNYNAVLVRRVTDPVALSDLAEIRAAAERAAAMTRQLLTFARRDVVHPAALDLNEVVRGVASMLDRTVGEHVDLRLDLQREMLIVHADRRQLEQVIVNLALNARDAMPVGGILTISTTASQEEGVAPETGSGNVAVLRVTDTGHGMTDNVALRAFDPFFTTKPHSQGTGLGLAMVHGIVAQNDGAVAIDSTVGVGTTVTVTLPRTADVLGASEPPAPAAAGGNERILLVEDEAALRLITARILAEHGYSVLTAPDGVHALEILERGSEKIDLLVTDMAMPRMNGDKLAQRLVERGIGVPVVFLTGHAASAQASSGRLLSKPVALDDLMRTIREALDD